MKNDKKEYMLKEYDLLDEKNLIFRHKVKGFYIIGEKGLYIPNMDLKQGIKKAILRYRSEKSYIKKRALYNLMPEIEEKINDLKIILEGLKW